MGGEARPCRDRVRKRALARALTPRADRQRLTAPEDAPGELTDYEQRSLFWTEHFKAGGTVDRRGRPCDPAEVCHKPYDPYYVPADELESYYAADPVRLGTLKVRFRPSLCSDDEVDQYRRAAAQCGFLSSEQLADVQAAIETLGGRYGSALLKTLVSAASSDESLEPIVAAELERRDLLAADRQQAQLEHVCEVSSA